MVTRLCRAGVGDPRAAAAGTATPGIAEPQLGNPAIFQTVGHSVTSFSAPCSPPVAIEPCMVATAVCRAGLAIPGGTSPGGRSQGQRSRDRRAPARRLRALCTPVWDYNRQGKRFQTRSVTMDAATTLSLDSAHISALASIPAADVFALLDSEPARTGPGRGTKRAQQYGPNLIKKVKGKPLWRKRRGPADTRRDQPSQQPGGPCHVAATLSPDLAWPVACDCAQ